MVYHIGVCAMVRNIPGPSHQKSKFIEKFVENKAEIERIDTGTSPGVAERCLIFSMLLPVLVYLTPCHMHMERGHTWVILYSQSLF